MRIGTPPIIRLYTYWVIIRHTKRSSESSETAGSLLIDSLFSILWFGFLRRFPLFDPIRKIQILIVDVGTLDDAPSLPIFVVQDVLSDIVLKFPAFIIKGVTLNLVSETPATIVNPVKYSLLGSILRICKA